MFRARFQDDPRPEEPLDRFVRTAWAWAWAIILILVLGGLAASLT